MESHHKNYICSLRMRAADNRKIGGLTSRFTFKSQEANEGKKNMADFDGEEDMALRVFGTPERDLRRRFLHPLGYPVSPGEDEQEEEIDSNQQQPVEQPSDVPVQVRAIQSTKTGAAHKTLFSSPRACKTGQKGRRLAAESGALALHTHRRGPRCSAALSPLRRLFLRLHEAGDGQRVGQDKAGEGAGYARF